MTYNEAKLEAKNYIANYITAKGLPLDKPFICLNPLHSDHKPSMSYDKNNQQVHCFSCGAKYDIFDLVEIDYRCTNKKEAFDKVYELYNIPIDRNSENGGAYRTKSPQPTAQSFSSTGSATEPTASEPLDLREQVERAHRSLMSTPDALEHFRARGFSDELIERYKLGYSEKGYNAFIEGSHLAKSKRLKETLYRYIVPFLDAEGGCSYFMSEISDRGQIDQYNGKHDKPKGTPAQIFNERYLSGAEPPKVIYICEAAYDALSIEETGSAAIALNGVGESRLLKLLGENKPATNFILALDDDDAGNKNSEKLKAKLTEAGYKAQRLDIHSLNSTGGKLDINDILKSDREALRGLIERATAEILTTDEELYRRTSAAYNIPQLLRDIEAAKRRASISTGFEGLDRILDGGLYKGLYIIGAISSLGKTTFCLQIADNIAQSGSDVLIFSLEMERNELISKSLSRLSYIECIQGKADKKHASSTRKILSGRATEYREDEAILGLAVRKYQQYAQHIFITYGMGDIDIETVTKTVEQHIKTTGNRPVVLIDYLQILAHKDERLTDKQKTDKNVVALKRLSVSHNIPVIAISSLNRDNYTEPINTAAFKESGAIEYSSDVLIGLQYSGMDFSKSTSGKWENDADRKKRINELINKQIEDGKQGNAQKIQCKVLKNRNGTKDSFELNFYPAFNYFEEASKKAKALDDYPFANVNSRYDDSFFDDVDETEEDEH